MSAQYATSTNQVAALKELYADDRDYLKDLVYKENPFFALVPKNEGPDGFGGKYLPIPLEYGTPQGASHTFSNAQNQQTAASLVSFFVNRISDYSLVTITNELMESTKTNAAAFVDAAKLQMDGGFRTITNRIAFELMSDGTCTRGATTASSSQTGASPNVVTLPLGNVQNIVNFEVGMLIVASTSRGGVIGATGVIVTGVNRATGVVTGNGITLATGATVASLDANFAIGSGIAYLSVYGDIAAGGSTSTATFLGLCGIGAWVPQSDPSATLFWSVDRTADPTRLAGLRYDASSFTIEEGITNALAFMSREGAKPDTIFIDFASYAALVNSLGAKVQYVQLKHDEVEVAFEGIKFQSAYGPVNVVADRNVPPQTAFILTMNTWKLRATARVPHILTYGLEGLEGLRVGSADALEIRIGYYGNLCCSAPGWNANVLLSA